MSDQCYLFDCSREPPPVDDDAGETDETLIPKAKKKNQQEGAEPEPEPEPELDAIP